MNTTRREVLRGGAAIVGSVALGAPALALAKSVKLGVLMPFSGGLELFGAQAMQGIEMLVDEVNGAGGVLGRQVEIIKADNRTDPKTSVERAQQLIRRDEVDAVIGPITSSARDAIKSSIERGRKPLLYATDYEGGVCSNYISCYSALPAHYVDPLIPYLMETVGRQVYLFGADYAWPQKMNVAIRTAVESAGGDVVGEEYTPFGVKDFATTIRKIEESGAETIILTLPGADGVTFIKQFTAAGMKEKSRLAFLGFNENYLPGLSAAESEGIIGCSHFIQTLDRPESLDFVARQKARYGDDVVVSDVVVAHYGITKFFLDAMQRADSDETNKIMAALPGSITVANGEVTMRADDKHVDLNMLLFEVRDQQLEMQKYIGKIIAPVSVPETAPFLAVREIVMDFGGIRALDKISLDLSRGEVKCIIGPNGCGKSTLFNVISGDLDPTSGQVFFKGDTITDLSPQKICRKGIARKFQIPSVFDDLTVAENIEIAITAATKHYAPFSLLRGGPDRSSYELVLAETRLLEYGGKLASELPHGIRQQLEIALLVVTDAQLLLLDEPTAGMSEEETDAIVHMIQDVRDRLGVAVLVIEHDMSFVRKLGSPLIVMMKGAVLREGNYAAISEDAEIRQAYLGDIE